MGEPSWKEIKTIHVPDRAAGVWTHALDWIAATKLYRVEVRATRSQGSPVAPAAVPQADEAKREISAPVAPEATEPVGRNTSTPVPGQRAPKEATEETGGADGATEMVPQATGTESQAGDNVKSNDGNLEEQTWTPLGSNSPCTADGDCGGLSRRDALIIPGARLGTLICKIGGSTADLVLDPNFVTVFPVGRFCVFKAPDEGKTGPLYFGINDSSAAAAQVEGSLEVVISVAL